MTTPQLGRRGQTMTQYILMIALLAIGLLLGASRLGNDVRGITHNSSRALRGADPVGVAWLAGGQGGHQAGRLSGAPGQGYPEYHGVRAKEVIRKHRHRASEPGKTGKPEAGPGKLSSPPRVEDAQDRERRISRWLGSPAARRTYEKVFHMYLNGGSWGMTEGTAFLSARFGGSPYYARARIAARAAQRSVQRLHDRIKARDGGQVASAVIDRLNRQAYRSAQGGRGVRGLGMPRH